MLLITLISERKEEEMNNIIQNSTLIEIIEVLFKPNMIMKDKISKIINIITKPNNNKKI